MTRRLFLRDEPRQRDELPDVAMIEDFQDVGHLQSVADQHKSQSGTPEPVGVAFAENADRSSQYFDAVPLPDVPMNVATTASGAIP